MFKYLISILLLCTPTLAQDKVDPPKPDTIPVVEKVSISVPKGVLGEGKRLAPYVFDGTTKCYISISIPDATSLKTLVWHLEDAPPDIDAINATIETPGTILVFTSGNTPGLYLVEADWDKGFSKIWLEIKGSGPPPPVVVIPPVVTPTDPTIPPGPVVDTTTQLGFRAMFVYESSSKLSANQSNIMTAVRIRNYLDAHCTKGTDGQYKGLPEYRFWDKDGKDAAKDSLTIKKMWSDLKPNLPGGTSTVDMPFLAIQANGKNVVVPIRSDATVESVMSKLISLGGPE